MKQRVNITLDKNLLHILNEERGLVKLSPFINSILKKYFKLNQEVKDGKR